MRAFTTILAIGLSAAALQAQQVTREDFDRLDLAERIVQAQRLEQIGLLGAYRAYQMPWAFRRPVPGHAPFAPAYPPVVRPGVSVAPQSAPARAEPDVERELGLDQPLPAATADDFTEEELAAARKLREDLLARVAAQFDLDLPTMRKLDNRLAELTPTELRALDRAWEQKQQQAERRYELREQEVLNEAKLNLQRAEAFRDHLQREFQLELLESRAEVEALNRAPLIWNSGALFPSPYGANPAYGFGYPPLPPQYGPVVPW